MKRGLVAAAGASAPVYEARLDRLRERLRAEGAIAALVYGDVYRSDDIAHLTNLCIYWNEGVLAVPADGPPAFLAKLSARVHPWMKRTSVLADLRASQKLPELIASYLDELGPGPVAFVDEAWWPAELVTGIREATGARDAIALPDAVRATRLTADEHDLADLRRAGEITAAALTSAAATDGDPATAIAAIELSARGAGARDVLAACRALPGGALQLELTVQYANVWAHAARVVGDDAGLADASRAAAEGLGTTARAADDAAITIVHHCDLGTAGDYRPAGDGAQAVAEGAVVSVAARSGEAVVADTYLIDGAGATALTAAEVTA